MKGAQRDVGRVPGPGDPQPAGRRVRGGATPEEVAAVVAAVAARRAVVPDGYLRWRRTRLAALRAGVGAVGRHAPRG